MAHLFYGCETGPAEIPDRILAHVKVVAATKLRRGESFLLTWRHPAGAAPGRTSIWMQPSIPLRFVFDDPEPVALDPEYLRDLANEANSSGGIMLEWQDEFAELDAAAFAPVSAADVVATEAEATATRERATEIRSGELVAA